MAQVSTYFPKVRRMLLCFSPLILEHFWPASTLLHGHIALAIRDVLFGEYKSFWRTQNTTGLSGTRKSFFFGYKRLFGGYQKSVLDFFGGQMGLINCKIVIDIFEGPKRQGWGFNGRRPKTSSKETRRRGARTQKKWGPRRAGKRWVAPGVFSWNFGGVFEAFVDTGKFYNNWLFTFSEVKGGLINCKIVLDILEGRKRQRVQRSAVQKAAASQGWVFQHVGGPKSSTATKSSNRNTSSGTNNRKSTQRSRRSTQNRESKAAETIIQAAETKNAAKTKEKTAQTTKAAQSSSKLHKQQHK